MPTWRELERFCRHEGWEYRPQNSGCDMCYTKVLRNGEVLWTRVSKSSGEIGKGLFAAILKNQLKVSLQYFNRVLSDKKHASDNAEQRRK